MDKRPIIQLQSKAISNIPFQTYENDFVFNVNGEKYETSRLVSDLLSPKICQIHCNDPTFSSFNIETKNSGDFSQILNLATFKQVLLPEDEIPFFVEILEILENKMIELTNLNYPVINEENVIKLLRQHEKFNFIFSDQISYEIELISQLFFKICQDNNFDELSDLSPQSIERIISHPKLHLKDEDQLFQFVTYLYTKYRNESQTYSEFYRYVLFSNVTGSLVSVFIEVFDYNDIDHYIWEALNQRLQLDMRNWHKIRGSPRYEFQFTEFKPQSSDTFCGIINFLKKQDDKKNQKKFTVSASSTTSSAYPPKNVTLFENPNSPFYTVDEANSWICYDFVDRRVVVSHYQLRSYSRKAKTHHPRFWVIEGSNNDKTWDPIDTQYNSAVLNGDSITHIFPVDNKEGKEFRYIRIRQTGPNWYGANSLVIDSFELYGTLI